MEKYALEKRQLLIAQQEKLWELELIRQKATAALAFQQRHDMHHHNPVIMDLLQSDDMDNLKDYLVSYDATLDANKGNLFCSNPIANSILNRYASRAEEKDIRTEFHISVPQNTSL